jgi:hypothetical protein
VRALREVPEIAKVEFNRSADSPMVLIHFRDWHHVPRDLCKLDGIDFEENLATAAKVQDDQLAIARFLIREHGLAEIFSEGLADESLPDLHTRLDLLRTLAKAERLAYSTMRADDCSVRRPSRLAPLAGCSLPARSRMCIH